MPDDEHTDNLDDLDAEDGDAVTGGLVENVMRSGTDETRVSRRRTSRISLRGLRTGRGTSQPVSRRRLAMQKRGLSNGRRGR